MDYLHRSQYNEAIGFIRNNTGYVPDDSSLKVACEEGNVLLIEELLRVGVRRNIFSTKFALRHRDPSVLKAFLSQTNNTGDLATDVLTSALGKGESLENPNIRILLEAGANPKVFVERVHLVIRDAVHFDLARTMFGLVPPTLFPWTAVTRKLIDRASKKDVRFRELLD